jgi:hypothetical protein
MPQLNLTLESPGVQIREIDLSLNPSIPVGTTVYVVGFSPQGPSDEPTYISSLSEYEEIFGLPETPAERYAYNSVKQVITTSNANLLFTRMPYGSGCGIGYSNSYSALVFPAIGVSATEVDVCDYYSALTESEVTTKFPWLYDDYFVKSSICIGSNKFSCPQTPLAAAGGSFVAHDYKFTYDGKLKNIKWVVDDDSSSDNFQFFLLRPTVDTQDCEFDVVTSFNLTDYDVAGDEDVAGLSIENGIANLDLTTGPTSADGGLVVQAGDLIATYDSVGVFKYYISSNGKSTILGETAPTDGDVFEAPGSGSGFNCLSGSLDYLIQFCYSPASTGLDCATLTALGVTVPEEDKYVFNPVTGDCQLNDCNFYVFGEPIHMTLSDEQYQRLKNQQFNWKCGCTSNSEALLDLDNNDVRAGLIIVNEAKTAQLDDFTGYYVAVNDNLNVNPATDFDEVTGVRGRYNEQCLAISGAWTPLPEARLNFNVSATFDGYSSISEIIEQNAGYDFGQKKYNDSLIVSVFKLRPTRFTEDIVKLDQILVEKFVGSLNSSRMIQDSFGGPPRTMYLEDVVNRNSNYLSMFVNPFISENNCWNNDNGVPQKAVRMFREKTGNVFDNFDADVALRGYADNLYGIGQYTGHCKDAVYDLCVQKDIGSLPCKLERALRTVENPMEYDLDLTVDGGLSTIWATREAVATDACLNPTGTCYHFDDTVFIDTNPLSPINGTSMGSPLKDGWSVIQNLFEVFAKGEYDPSYPGHLHIADPLRQIFVNGKDFRVVNRQKQTLLDPLTGNISKRYSTFSRNIYTYLRNLFDGVNSSYCASYANWIRDYDKNRDKYCWFPSSAYVAAAMARTDQNYFPWFATMGPTRGGLSNVLQLAINPSQKERDLLYRINLNPIVNLPGEGNLIWGQKTLQRTESALDRINVRRLLLELEKATQRTLWQFIGEPNTLLTRTRVLNVLTPIFENAKNNQGLYDFLIVCDERNNTADTIDQNALNVDIYLKPVKAIEFIAANFIITRTGVDFGELL